MFRKSVWDIPNAAASWFLAGGAARGNRSRVTTEARHREVPGKPQDSLATQAHGALRKGAEAIQDRPGTAIGADALF